MSEHEDDLRATGSGESDSPLRHGHSNEISTRKDSNQGHSTPNGLLSSIFQLIQATSARNQPKSLVNMGYRAGLSMLVAGPFLGLNPWLTFVGVPLFTLAMVGIRWAERRIEERK